MLRHWRAMLLVWEGLGLPPINFLDATAAPADMTGASVLSQAIWFSVRGPRKPMLRPLQLPVFKTMRVGISEEEEAEEDD